MAGQLTAVDVTGAGLSVSLTLPHPAPIDVTAVLDFLGAHAVPGLETYAGGVYTRAVDASGGPAVVALSAAAGGVRADLRLADGNDQPAVVARVRRLLDLDTDPTLVDAALGADPDLAPLVRRRSGIRSPGAVSGFETAVRTIVGQQVSLRGAATVTGRIVAEHGRRAFADAPWLLFPTADALADADPQTLPLPRARGRSIRALAEAGLELEPGADRQSLRRGLLALPGVGPWTADYLLMRVTGSPDILLDTDLIVRRAAAVLGIQLTGGRPDWAPWRSYATHHLWAHAYGESWAAARNGALTPAT